MINLYDAQLHYLRMKVWYFIEFTFICSLFTYWLMYELIYLINYLFVYLLTCCMVRLCAKRWLSYKKSLRVCLSLLITLPCAQEIRGRTANNSRTEPCLWHRWVFYSFWSYFDDIEDDTSPCCMHRWGSPSFCQVH